jgi:hypothetical protein
MGSTGRDEAGDSEGAANEVERERVRVAINMLREDFDELKRLAQDDGETVSGYLRKALATERFLKDRTKEGGRILVEEDGVQREIVFR